MLGFYPDSRIVPHLVCQDSADIFECFGAFNWQKSLHLCVCVYLLIFGVAPWLRLLSWASAHGQGSSACLGQAKNGGHWCQGRLRWAGSKSWHRNQLAGITFDTNQEGSCVRGSSMGLGNAHIRAAVAYPKQLHLHVLPFLSSQTWKMLWMKLFLLWFILAAALDMLDWG